MIKIIKSSRNKNIKFRTDIKKFYKNLNTLTQKNLSLTQELYINLL